MGRAKRQFEDELSRGYRSPANRHVCAACASEPALAEYVRSHVSSRNCDYCGRRSSGRLIATDLDGLLELIAESLESEYGDPAEELPFESAEGGYQGQVLETWELLLDLNCDLGGGRLLEDVAAAFLGRVWCQRDYFSLPKHQALTAGWQQFSDEVVHRTRFVFLSAQPNEAETPDPEVPRPSEVLTLIDQAVTEVGLAQEFPAGTRWYRARAHSEGDIPTGASELGPPPPERAAASRMSPGGIPMFYGARDEETAVAEVTAIPQNAHYPLATVGCFVSARPSLLLDLTSLPPIPSLFDRESRHLRVAVRFLREFVRDLSQPVSRDGAEHLEYVPSQIVTEWFRRVHVTVGSCHLDGIVYPSAQRPGGVCCVLFSEGRDVCDAAPGWQLNSARDLALENSWTKVTHPGFLALASSEDFAELRRKGLRAVHRNTLFRADEWGEFALRSVSTPEYVEFCADCRALGDRYGVSEWSVKLVCLVEGHTVELDPFPIGADWRHLAVVAAVEGDALFMQWLRFEAWRLGLRLIVSDGGREAVAIAVPFPAAPQEPLTEARRPPVSRAFKWRLEIPASYTPAAASAVAWDAQHLVRELLVRLGY